MKLLSTLRKTVKNGCSSKLPFFFRCLLWIKTDIISLLTIAIVFATVTLTTANAAIMHDIDFEGNAYVETNGFPRYLWDQGQSYRLNRLGWGGVQYASINASQELSFTVPAIDPASTDRQRSELVVGDVTWGDQHYATSLYIPNDFPTPQAWTIIQQWHSKAGAGPPATLNLVPDLNSSGVALTFNTKRNYGNGDNYEVMSPVPLAKGQWHRIVVRIKFSTGSDGRIVCWLNGVMKCNYHGKVGRQKDFDARLVPEYTLGIYRGSQNITSTLLYDNIKVGRWYSEVANP